MNSRHWQDFTVLGAVLSPAQFKVLWTPFLNIVHSCTDSAITQSAEVYTRKKNLQKYTLYQLPEQKKLHWQK